MRSTLAMNFQLVQQHMTIETNSLRDAILAMHLLVIEWIFGQELQIIAAMSYIIYFSYIFRHVRLDFCLEYRYNYTIYCI